MINLETVHFFKEILTNLIAYIPTITFAGFFSTWIAKKLGDNTAAQNGYLTLNPIAHMDPLGIVLMVIPPYLGFSRGVPLNANNVTGKHRRSKITFLYLSRALAYFIVLLFAIFAINLVKKYFITGVLAQAKVSSLVIVFLMLFKAIIGLSVFCAVLHFVSGVIRTFTFFYFPNIEENPNYIYIMFLLPILLFFVFGPIIENILRLFIINMDRFFMYLLS